MFFLAYQRTANRTAVFTPALVPTEAERRGDFSRTFDASGQRVRPLDPTTGQPFPNGTVPESRISPQARALLALYPLPDFAGSRRYNYQVPLAGATHQDDFQSRIDRAFGRRDTVFGNFALPLEPRR